MMVCSLSKKYMTCTCSACLEWVGIYTLAEILSKILEKMDGKLMTFFTIMICLFRDLMLTSLLADILYGHCPHDRRLWIRKMLMNRKMKYFQKCDFLLFFYTFLSKFGSLQEHYICLLNNMFCFICSEHVSETIRRTNILVCFKLCSRKLSPMPLPPIFKKWVG